MARRSVLFIGNSFTARNDMPSMVAQLAESRKHTFDAKLISAGGASLRMHWNRGVALREIERRRYDRVVLQEQSTLPVKNPARMHENVRLFQDAIKAAGANTVLYMTWARRHAPETQSLIVNAYTSIASELGAEVIPAGLAWQLILKRSGHPELYDRDGSHPTLAGSYLAACCAFAVLLGDDPVGSPPPLGLTTADAAVLQHAAVQAIAAR